MKNLLSRVHRRHVLIAALILSIPAFLVNLGLMTFIEDEAIRALVAMEMMYSGDFISPTLNGTAYYYKPPLYNWILVFFYSILGEVNEWTSRIPTVVFTYLFGAVIYFLNKDFFGRKASAILALSFLTCGRVLFWDSFLGLIDIFYSLVMYLMIILVYVLSKKEKWWMMYISVYLLCTAGYMLKGFPSFLFLGFSFLGLFIIRKSIKGLFSLAHLSGLVLMCGLIGTYYYYSLGSDAAETIAPLLSQSTVRTPLNHDIKDVFLNLFTYPFENVYHFFPWSLFAILLIRKDVIKLMRQNEYVSYVGLAFLLNISIYWVSPGAYPRYILMLMPMFFTLCFYIYERVKEEDRWQVKSLRYLMLGLMISLPIVSMGLFVVPTDVTIDYFYLKAGSVVFGVFFCALLYYFRKSLRIYALILMCFLIRLAFDWTILPERHHGDYASMTKEVAIELGDKYADNGFYLYENSKVDYTSSFYISRRRDRITTREYSNFDSESYYVVDTQRAEFPTWEHLVVDSFPIREFHKKMYIIQPAKDQNVNSTN